MKKLFSVLAIVLLISAINNDSFAQYNVNGGGNIPTLQAALTAASNTAGASVILNVTASVGAEVASTLPAGTRTGTLLIRASGGKFTITTASATPLITLDGARNVTIDGSNLGAANYLTFVNTNVALTAGCIALSNGSSNNVIRNVTCKGVGVSTTQGGRIINVSQSALDAQGGNNNNIIERDTVIGGRRGIQVFGTAPAGTQLGVTNNGTIIRNNVIKNASSLGVFIGSETRDNTVDSNEVLMDNPPTVSVGAGTNFRGINCQGVGTNNITRNRIHDLIAIEPTATYFGILSIPVTLTAPGSNTTTDNYINNCVTLMTNNDGFVEGIAISFIAQAYTANVDNNTIRLAGSAATSVGSVTDALDISNTFAGSTVNVYNNIAINNKTGGINDPTMTQHLALDFTSYPAVGIDLNSDYNLGKSTDPVHGYDGGYNGFIFKNASGLEGYRFITCDSSIEQNSVFKDLVFTGGVNSCVLGLNGGDLCGKPLALVPRDIFNVLRNTTYPYKGCWEGPALKILSLKACLEGKVAGGQVNVAIKTGGCVTITSCYGYLNLATNSVNLCYDGLVANSVGYYLVITSINHVQTASALANVTFAAGGPPNASYDFTTGQNKAFGNNQTSGPPFCFYGGDVNQDGTVDITDLGLIDNDESIFLSGCRLSTDVNSDGTVDVTDGAITENNAFNFIGSVLPCPEPTSISKPDVERKKVEVIRNTNTLSSQVNN